MLASDVVSPNENSAIITAFGHTVDQMRTAGSTGAGSLFNVSNNACYEYAFLVLFRLRLFPNILSDSISLSSMSTSKKACQSVLIIWWSVRQFYWMIIHIVANNCSKFVWTVNIWQTPSKVSLVELCICIIKRQSLTISNITFHKLW